MRLLGAHLVEIFPMRPPSPDPGKQRVGDAAVKDGGEDNTEYGCEQVNRSSLVPGHEATNQNGWPEDKLGQRSATFELGYREEDWRNPYQEGKQGTALMKAADQPSE
jgi:hypothetical protein